MDNSTSFVSRSAEDTITFAEQFARKLKAGDVILYEGDLGAGKTAFTKGIAKALEITDIVTSPTFALVNEYYGTLPLFHFDLYRLNDFDDLYATGFFDYLNRGGIIAAEWSENIPYLADDLNDGQRRVYTVRIEKLKESERKIIISELI